MSFAITRTTGNGSTPTFTIGFSYRDEADLIVKVNGVTQTLGTHFQVTTGGTIIDFSQGSSPLGAPTNGHSVFISRATSQTSRLVDYAAGSVFKEADLDTDSEQGFFMAQEAIDIANESITVDANNNWDAGNKRIINVADPVNNQDAVNKQFISTNLPNITTVAGIAQDVTDVAGIASDVTAVAADATDIGTVSTNIGSVNTVANNINDVVTVANDLNEAISEIETAADDLNDAVSDIDTVSTNIANVNAVGGDITNVNTVAGQISPTNNVSTVAGVSTEISTVAGQISPTNNVQTVANSATQIGTVAGQISPTNNIQTVANAATNIGTVATDLSGSNNIGTVATDIANVNLVGADITNVNTVATNISDVNNFADTYFISATAPASPTQGDLWFDTDPASLTMKVYDGSGWVNAGSSVNGTSNRTTYTATAGQTSFAATYDAGFVDVYLNGVKLINGTDFTATNGTSVVLTTGAALNDTVDIVGYGTFELQNTSLDDLSDVSSASASSGQFLKYNGTNWVADSVPASNDASALTTGTLDAARLPTTGVDASSLSTGTLAAARLPTTGVSASSLTTGTLPSARLDTGTVLQVKGDMNTTAVTNSIQGWTDSGLSVSITPSSSSNYFLVVFEGHFKSDNTTSDKGFGFNIYKDGTAVTSSPNDGSDRPYDFYQDDSGNGERFFRRQGKTYYAQTGTTNSVTFTVSFTGYVYSSQGDVVLGMDNETQHTLTVYEIAG